MYQIFVCIESYLILVKLEVLDLNPFFPCCMCCISRSSLTDIDDLTIENCILTGTNICTKNNGGCQQLCLYRGKGQKTCGCSYSVLAEDSVSCRDYDGYLLYSERTILKSIHLTDETNLNPPIKPYEKPEYFKNVIALAFDYRRNTRGTNRIFTSDVHFGNIQLINDDWTGRRVIIESKYKAEMIEYCVHWIHIFNN